MVFDAASLMDRACAEAGLQDYGPAPLREPLERFCHSLNREAGLSGPAAASAENMILSSLAERLRLQSWFARHPEILEQRIKAPLNVIGLPRSGTTALSQFLSKDPAMRSIRRWELSTPTPPPDETQGEDPRIAATRAAFERRDAAMPAFRTMLPVTESDPSEHNAPMNFTFMNLQLPSLYDVPSFGEWLQEADLTPGYDYLSDVLRLLQWKTPRERWNLKNPMDLFVIPQFMRVFPDALLIWAHRDPASTLASNCSLVTLVRESTGQTVDKHRLGRNLLDYLRRGVGRAMRARREHASLKIVDLYNKDLGRDPIGTIEAAYDRLGLAFSDPFRRRLEARLRERPRGQFGKHDYALEEFGLNLAEVRAAFRDYTEAFQVPLER
jgi:hypothetical protein